MNQQNNQTRWLALVGAAMVAIYLCWLMLRPFVDVLLWAAVLVVVFYPMYERLERRLRRPGLSALLSCLVVMVVVAAPLTFIVIALTTEFTKAVQHLPAEITRALDPTAPVTGRIVRWLQRFVDLSPQFLIDQLTRMTAQIVSQSIGLVGGAIGVLLKGFFVIFTMFYLFRDGDRIVRALPEFLPLKREQSEQVFERTREVINASVYGVVSIAMVQGALAGLAFWFLGIPSPVLWGVVTALVCMIPVAGSFLVWLPASVYLALTGHWTRATLLTLWGLFVISTIDNFLRPKLIRGRTKLHELLVFFAVLGGLRVFGVLGIVLGPVVLAIAMALVEIFRQSPNEDAIPL